METVLDQVADAGDDLKPEPVETKAEPAEAAKPEPAKADEKGVPLAALHEAREETRALKAQIKELEAQPRLTAEDRELLADLKKQRPGAPKDPEFLEDPKGYVDAQVKRAAAALEKLEKGQTEISQSAAQQRDFQQLMSNLQQNEAKFVTDTPDYFDALKFMRAKRVEQLQIIYPDATDAQISQAISQEEIVGAAQALKGGKNPAEVAYRFAKTMGYAAPVKDDPKKANGAAKSAARSLGGSSGGGEEIDAADTEDTMPEFSAALRERFGARKR